MRRLVVNVDHIATVRQARGGVEPDPVGIAGLAILAGADGIVVHLREDRRHIQDRDLGILRQTVHGLLCLEMAPTPEMLKIALEVRPQSVTLVPERRAELTTEGGLDVMTKLGQVGEVVRLLHDGGIRSCLFVDPEADQIKACHRLDANSIEIHTGRYAEGGPDRDRELRRIVDAASIGAKLGLEVGVGHGLDRQNVRPLVRVPDIVEFSIGHSIVSHALAVGMERAVREMREIIVGRT